MVKFLKFVCKKCCDEITLEPCSLKIPMGAGDTVQGVMAGLTTCPLEGCNYVKGKWVKNGENYTAEWERA